MKVLPLLLLSLTVAACDKPQNEPPATPAPSPVARGPADPKGWMNGPTALDRKAPGTPRGTALDQPAFRDGHGRH